MSQLYLWLNLGSLAVPFLFSFHPKIQFYKHWSTVFPGILVMMLIFIPWDIYFTQHGFWGFNPDYLTGISLWGLPLEEWLFFVCIIIRHHLAYYMHRWVIWTMIMKVMDIMIIWC